MKTFHKIDFYLQIVLFALAGVCIITMPFGGLIYLLFLQFFVGCWQLLSAILSGTTHWKSDTGRLNIRYYWLGVGVWMAVMALVLLLEKGGNDVMGVIGFGWLLVSWALAVYYFLITRKYAKQTANA
jgi:hypothetical protein